ncbi:MAG TPA: hypothetical protein VK885_12930 [Desulfotignum sp.]|jgi:hypothetical protein|nr:hypothetical protein [Desulfotignum sp.]
MATDIYRRLQQQLSHYAMGLPETASGSDYRTSPEGLAGQMMHLASKQRMI